MEEVSTLNTCHLHVIGAVWADWNQVLSENLQKGESNYDIISSLITVLLFVPETSLCVKKKKALKGT